MEANGQNAETKVPLLLSQNAHRLTRDFLQTAVVHCVKFQQGLIISMAEISKTFYNFIS
jgi:hypothetical protein